MLRKSVTLILAGLSGVAVASLVAGQPSGADQGACTLPIANCTTEQQPSTEQPPPTETTAPETTTPSPDTGQEQGQQPSQSQPGQGKPPSGGGEDQEQPILPSPPTQEEADENALLESILGKSTKALTTEDLPTITDCPAKGKPKPGSDCFEALRFGSKAGYRFDREFFGASGPPTPGANFAAGVALLAGLHDKSNSKPPTWAFPSIHAALPVLLKLARWGADTSDPDRAYEANTAAKRLANMLLRNDLEGRKLK